MTESLCKPINVLEWIRKTPAMYLGLSSVSALFSFIAGYLLALDLHGVKDDKLQLPEDFDDWVAYRLHYRASRRGWRNMVVETAGDQAEGLTLFFELLDQHAARKGKVIAQLIGLEKSYKAGPPDSQFVDGHYPTRISLIAYTDDPGFFVASDEAGVPWPSRPFCPSLECFLDDIGADQSQLTVIDPETFAKCTLRGADNCRDWIDS